MAMGLEPSSPFSLEPRRLSVNPHTLPLPNAVRSTVAQCGLQTVAPDPLCCAVVFKLIESKDWCYKGPKKNTCSIESVIYSDGSWT